MRHIHVVKYKGRLILKTLYFRLRECRALTKWINLVKRTHFDTDRVIMTWTQPFGERPPRLTVKEREILTKQNMSRIDWRASHVMWIHDTAAVNDLGRLSINQAGVIMRDDAQMPDFLNVRSQVKRTPKKTKYSFV